MVLRIRIHHKLLVFTALLLFASCSGRRAVSYQRAQIGSLQARLDSITGTSLFDSTQLGLMVYDITADQPLYRKNASHRMRPASCQKLITSITALRLLGGDYTLHTDLYTTGAVSNGTLQGDVWVKGGMDPLFSKADAQLMAAALPQAGIRRVAGRLLMDVSMKDSLRYGPGWCWDDHYGPLSALMVEGRDSFAAIWPAVVRSTGIALSDSTVGVGEYQGQRQPVCTVTHTLDQVLRPMLKNSDNILAESLFYQLAALSGEKRAGRAQAVEEINRLTAELGLNPQDYVIADGSGLSLYNYLSPELLVRFLNYAWRDEAIRTHLWPALPVAGVDGTLAGRMTGTPAAGNVRAKTGSVSGVSSLSGYLTARNGHLLSFSIINQGVPSARVGRAFQDKVCLLLCEGDGR